MDDAKETKTYLWGSITNKIDKIEAEADRLEWDAIIDMVADILATINTKNIDPLELFTNLYQFTFRLYYRLKAYSSPAPFNQVSKTTRREGLEDIPFYQIKNYDYKMFLWAKQRGYTEYLANDWFLIPESDLSASEKRKFDKEVGENL